MLFPFFIFSAFAVMFLIWIFLAYWVYKDAQKRKADNPAIWLLIILIGGIIGLIVWLIVRPPIGGDKKESDRICTNCGRKIPFDAKKCPYCGKEFKSYLNSENKDN